MHELTARSDSGGPGVWRREPDQQLTFAGQAASIGVLRDWVSQHLRMGGFGYPEALAEALLLCASELGTNAVRHSRSGLPGGVFTASLWQAVDGVCLEVRDMGPRPGVRSAPHIASGAVSGVDAESGRGLGFVSALCGGRMGGTVPPHPRGHTVWCELSAGEAGEGSWGSGEDGGGV
ncbi:ATP-binding protein [Nocardiopsis chromatogenes]|uniref:ATP-binding protein n=1 Tax=Nocardiopsis chromatogenes TaxID=280239 RepID=UPI00034D0AB0|nr:ATP-binding protein [Nocardiopsis chromatogenes]